MVITRMMADRGQPSKSPTPTENIFDQPTKDTEWQKQFWKCGRYRGKSSWSFYNSTFYWKEHFKRFNNQPHIRDNDMQNKLLLTRHRFIMTTSLPAIVHFLLAAHSVRVHCEGLLVIKDWCYLCNLILLL